MGQNGAMAQKWDILARDKGQKYQEIDLLSKYQFLSYFKHKQCKEIICELNFRNACNYHKVHK
jgi:hypothetical protein